MKIKRLPNTVSWVIENTIVLSLYCFAALVSLQFAYQDTNASPIWIPSGIAFVAILLRGYRLWPGIFIGAFLANTLTFHINNSSASLVAILIASFGIAIGNTLEAVFGIFLLRRWISSSIFFDQIKDVVKFVFVSLATALIASTIGPMTLSLIGIVPWKFFGVVWFTWWLGDSVGILIIAPLLLARYKSTNGRWGWGGLVEAVFFFLFVLSAAWEIFGGQSHVSITHYPVEFLLIPLIVFAAFCFGRNGAILAVLSIAGIAIEGTVNGFGPFFKGTVNESLLLLQTFLGVSVTMGLITAAALVEEKKGQEASNQLAAIINFSHDAIVGKTLAGIITSWNMGAQELYGYTANEIVGKPIHNLSMPGHHYEIQEILRRIRDGEKIEHYETIRKRKDGRLINISLAISPIKNANGKIIGASSIAHDITAHKRMETALKESEERFRTLANHAPVGIFLTDALGHCLYVNNRWCDLAGMSLEEAKDEGWVRALHPEDNIRVFNEWSLSIKTGKEFNLEFRFKTPEGKISWLSGSAIALRNDQSEITGYLGTVTDITDQKLSEHNLNVLKDRLELEKIKVEQVLNIEESLNTIVNFERLIDFIVRKTAEVLEAQKCSLMLFDETTQELCIKGHNGIMEEVISHNRLKIGESIAGEVFRKKEPVLVRDIEADERFLRKSRPHYQSNSFMVVPIRLDNNMMGVINVADKINGGQVFSNLDLKILNMISRHAAVAIENAKLYRELKHLTITDPITNLYNYRHLAKSLDHEIKRVKRYSGSLCLLMMDVDNFKEYNDSFGHLEGDAVLREVARTLTENLRDVDIACRYAGDEFVIILPGVQLSDAKIVAEKIRDKLSHLALKKTITASIGIAKYVKDMDRYDLILVADTALYRAKKENKKKVHATG